MKPDKLHRFLHALNLGEQRMCKKAVVADTSKWAAQRKKLFATLMLQQTYDAAKLSKAIGDAAYLAELPTEKNRMYKRLLHTVLEHRASNEDSVDPMAKLRESKLLYSLGLTKEARDTVIEGLGIARELDDPLVEALLCNQLRLIVKFMPTEDDLCLMARNEEQMIAAAQRVPNLMELHVLADRAVMYNRRYKGGLAGKAKQEMEALMAHPLLSSADNAQSFMALLRYHSAWLMYHECMNDLPNCVLISERVVELYDSRPACRDINPGQFLIWLSNHTGLLMRVGQYGPVPELLQRMERMEFATKKDRVEAFVRLEQHYQLYAMNSSSPQTAIDRQAKVAEGLETYGDMVGDGIRLSLLYNIAVSNLVMGNNWKAQVNFSRIREMGMLLDRVDLQGLARLFRLLLILESETDRKIEHYMRNSRRFFHADHTLYPMEDMVYGWIERMAQQPDGKLPSTGLKALYDALAQFETQGLIGAEELRLWALGRARGMPLHQLKWPNHGSDRALEAMG
jgi:hypothetical protein